MSSRQARRERRAAERKAKKAELKRNRQLATAARPDEAALFSEPKIQENEEAERKAKKAEFQRLKAEGRLAATATASSVPVSSDPNDDVPPQVLADAYAIRDRIYAQLVNGPDRPSIIPSPTGPGFVWNDEPAVGIGLDESDPVPSEPLGFVSQSLSTSRAEINRANAQHSTGPRSETGKLASSRNSLKHGLASGVLIVRDEDPAAFEQLKTDLFDEHQPATDTEALLVTEMAQSWWLFQRAVRLQNECFTGAAMDEKRLALFLRYQTTHERAFHKALNTLIRLKKDRLKADRGFVSQNASRPASEHGFVSQKRPQAPSQPRFLSQNNVAPDAEFGFVSQNPDEFPEFAPAAAKKDAA